MNILRLVLLGLAALGGTITRAALLQKAIRPETSSAPMIATASTRPGEPDTPPTKIDAARRAFEEKLKMAPEYAAFFDRLKTVFPSEYEFFSRPLPSVPPQAARVKAPICSSREAARSLRRSRGIFGGQSRRAGSGTYF